MGGSQMLNPELVSALVAVRRRDLEEQATRWRFGRSARQRHPAHATPQSPTRATPRREETSERIELGEPKAA
jgi:hypothetical protein